MKIPVDIRVHNERTHPGFGKNAEEHIETDEFKTTGVMKKTKGGYRIEFREENKGGTTTIDTTKDDMVTLYRIGPVNSGLVFAEGKAFDCINYSPVGMQPFRICVRTKSLKNTLSMDGGKLNIDYSVEVAGNLAEKNKLSLSVCPDISILKS